MAGFTAPNQYEPHAGWRQTLFEWVVLPPHDRGSWQYEISVYWRWRTVDGLSLSEAWGELGMEPAAARAALAPSADSGLVPPELFSRVLARSRATTIDPDDDVSPVVITPAPGTNWPDDPQVGFTPEKVTAPAHPPLYRPRPGWKGVLLKPPMNSAGWLAELHLYWRRRTEGHQSLMQAWDWLRFHPTNAGTSLNPNLADRGSIPPELIGRVVARSQAKDIDPNDNVEGIILYPS